MTKSERKQAAAKAVAKRGITFSSAYNRRTATSMRLTEASRKTAQASVRAAKQKA